MEGQPVTHSLQQIFEKAFGRFACGRRLRNDVRNAAWAILTCRTAVRGGHVERCPNGHFKKTWYNSCLHRSCPQCGFSKLMEWLEAKKRMLLPCGHFHLTFGFPSELLSIWRYNRRVMGNLLFQVVASSLREALGDSGFVVGKPGFLLSLHTWNRRLGLHPHMHCLVTGGGFYAGQWRDARIRQWLMPTEKIRQVYREHMTRALRRMLERGELRLPPSLSKSRALALVQSLARKPWIVDRRKRYNYGSGIATYLARYLRGGPIRNRRIVDTGDHVTFVVSRKDEEVVTETVPVSEFLRRVLDHVFPKGFRAIRGYGLYAHTSSDELEECREALLTHRPELAEEALVLPERPTPRESCPVCGSQLEAGEPIPATRAGPLLEAFS